MNIEDEDQAAAEVVDPSLASLASTDSTRFDLDWFCRVSWPVLDRRSSILHQIQGEPRGGGGWQNRMNRSRKRTESMKTSARSARCSLLCLGIAYRTPREPAHTPVFPPLLALETPRDPIRNRQRPEDDCVLSL